MKRALITGISGSGGSYLAEHIIKNQQDVEVHGISRWHNNSSNKNLEKITEKIRVYECDLTDFSSVLSALKESKPDYIFHLASHANVRASFDTPLSIMNNNIVGTHNLLEAVRHLEISPLIQICSTSEVYGKVDPKNVPITEDCPINPVSPYAVSKTTQDLLGYAYFMSYGMPIIRTRMFSYINPRREGLFATNFAMQIAKIENGLQKEILHGNLDSTRTLIDVRDAMESYWLAIEKGKPGEVYNIGGENIIKVGEFLDILKSLSTKQIPSRVDPKLLRPIDVTLQIPDTRKFREATGWKPKYSFEESVGYLLEHCRNEVKKEHGILQR
jgi:GDPmannose 4,6-dehydratase/GDP-4-dehydro-6-deoxy-D-mannose reductase